MIDVNNAPLVPEVELHNVPFEKSDFNENASSLVKDSVKDRIAQISSYVLIVAGVLFLLVSLGLFASSLFAVSAAPATLAGELYPIGVFSLLGGVNFLQDGKANPLRISTRLGPVSLSI